MAMKVRRKRESSRLVIWVVFGLMVMGMGLLVSKLWELQVQHNSGFEEVFRNQSVRRVRLPAVRGKIYDTNGECLADSIPNYCIAIFTEELRAPRSAVANTLELVHEIWARVGKRPDITYRDIQRHISMTPNEPLVAWKELDSQNMARWRAKFEDWTAPPKGSLSNRRQKIPGLDLGRPTEGKSIVIKTADLKERGTSTAANTLELVYEISERIGIPKTVRFQDIKDHIYARRPLPLLAWKNLDEETMAKWADTCSSLAGTDIYYQPARTYPFGATNAHLVGFTLEADAIREEEGGERVHFDMRGIQGRKGLESTYNELLEGEPGHQLVQIDVSGFHHRNLQSQPAKAGGDLLLTIDSNIQRFAMEALAMKQDGEDPDLPVRGAVVVLEPDTGDVLAMVSSPSFDPNIYMQSKAYRQALLKDKSARTYHRAVFGQYPPGSTFKPVAALGVLRDHPDYTDTIHNCVSPYYVGRRRMRCWVHPGAHGEYNIRQALMQSCNVFMFEMAREIGYESIRAMANEFGLGQYAGLFPNLDEEPEQRDLKYGNLPQTSYNETDTCNMSIGQGAITASPLQMAMVASTIANGGRLYRPRLVEKFRSNPNEDYKENPTWEIRRVNVPVEALETVRGGMYDVIMHSEGTAKKARVPGIAMAGKTGSAQYKKKVDGEVVSSVHTWMISYAPFDFPRYAVAMIVEDGVSGGNTVGPRLSQLYTKIFEYDGTLTKEVM